jgi:hypothetical protein
MHLDKIFYTPFLSHKFPDNTELNKNLIDEIEQEKLLAPDGDTRSFASTPNNTWQSNTKMQHTYHSFRALTRQIDDLLLEEEMQVSTCWANLIHGAGGFSFPHTHNSKKNEIRGSVSTKMTAVYFPKGLVEKDNFMKSRYSKDEGDLILFSPNFAYKNSHTDVLSISVVESLLVVFPNNITHMVKPMQTNTKRYSIVCTFSTPKQKGKYESLF